MTLLEMKRIKEIKLQEIATLEEKITKIENNKKAFEICESLLKQGFSLIETKEKWNYTIVRFRYDELTNTINVRFRGLENAEVRKEFKREFDKYKNGSFAKKEESLEF